MDIQTDTKTPEPRLTRAQKGEVVGGGYIVASRDKKGRLCASPMPFEHPSAIAALLEAERVSIQPRNKGKTFVIMQVWEP